MKTINCKLGNMRKEANWVLYPQEAASRHKVVIQCDKRIAMIDMETGKGTLSDGKNGHQGFMKLSKSFGAFDIDVPNEIVAKLKELTGTNTVGNGIGAVTLSR